MSLLPQFSLRGYFLLLTTIVYCCKPSAKDTDQTSKIPICNALAVMPSLSKLPKPLLKTQIGNSHLTITTKSTVAQQWFDQGLNQLHAFGHLEAYRAFREVINADSTAAMGYWGIAMCKFGFGGDDNTLWSQAIAGANRHIKNCTHFEEDLIVTTTVLMNNGMKSAAESFRQLAVQYPDNPEALAFAATVLRQSIQSPQENQQLKELLEAGLKKFPNHVGLMHYYVHVMEVRPDFRQAKPIAQRMAQLAPNASHLQHMPGHLYYLEGNYNNAVKAFAIARTQENYYHQHERIPENADQNYLHNLHFLAITYSELGQEKEALEAANAYARVEMPTNTADVASLLLQYEGRLLPALVYLRFQKFNRVHRQLAYWLNHPNTPPANPLVKTYLQALIPYCKGMQAVRSNQRAEAIEAGRQLTQLMQSFEQQGALYQYTTEFRLINKTYDIMSIARFELAGWIDNMDASQPFNNMAWEQAFILEKAIQYEEPPRLIFPVAESLGYLYKQRGDAYKAKEAWTTALKKRPKSPIIKKLIASLTF
ncbi:MAG: hypothetical protein MUF12_01905 [Sediminibacterium sp.]|nr:hypothetical protein [Sediminibacterium sp.]